MSLDSFHWILVVIMIEQVLAIDPQRYLIKDYLPEPRQSVAQCMASVHRETLELNTDFPVQSQAPSSLSFLLTP